MTFEGIICPVCSGPLKEEKFFRRDCMSSLYVFKIKTKKILSIS